MVLCDVVLCGFFFFFFSSRRRHTRSLRDWSSDVCSSDLFRVAKRWHGLGPVVPVTVGAPLHTRNLGAICDQPRAPPARSEERRVGKECRSRWSPEHQKKKNKRRQERSGTYT